MTNETIFIIKLISRKSTNREFTILIYKKYLEADIASFCLTSCL